MPDTHAKLGPSSSHRWLNCTASVEFENEFPEKSPGVYAAEGTLAHEFCEVFGKKAFKQITSEEFIRKTDELSKNELYAAEMLRTASFYVDTLKEAAAGFDNKPAVAFEQQVSFEEYVPYGFGTCDCIMVGDDTLRIFDYKHGKGVEVSAIENSQMRLYALGALLKYQIIYGDSIKKVKTAIIQPRITEDVSTEDLTVEELLAWGEAIKPKAIAAYTGQGAEFHAGDWCRFCRGKGACRERAKGFSAIAELQQLRGEANKLTPDELRTILCKSNDVQAWVDSVKEYAQEQILAGNSIEGFKVVESKTNRAWKNEASQGLAFAAIQKAGVATEESLYEKKPLTLSAVERLIGKAYFSELCAEHIHKPHGSPTLAPQTDKRPDYAVASAEKELEEMKCLK